jgi:hypothetical protein
MKYLRLAVLAGLVAGIAACGSSSSSVNLDLLNRVDVDAGLAPLQNGFAFSNFGASTTAEQFDANDLVTMFGAGACVDGTTDPCVPTAQASAWARMVNDARQSGHCEGLVVQASARFNAKAAPQTAALARDNEVIHGVYRAFATQFLPEVQDSTKEWSGKSLIDIVNELVASLEDGITDYSMGLYSDGGGHSVLPFAVQFTQDNLAIISVYDSNWPGMDRYVVVDFVKNEWFFSFSGRNPQEDECVWSGGEGDIDLTPLESRTSAACPFCGDKTTVTKSMLLIRSTSDDWSIETSNGTYSPQSDTVVEGVNARSVRTADCTDKTRLPEFVIAIEALQIQITLPDDASAYISNGRSVIEIKTSGKKKRNPIVIDRDTVTINDPDTTTTVSNDNLAVVVTAPQAQISLGTNNINVSVNNGKENVSVNAENPRQEVTVNQDNNVVVTDATEATNNVAPVVPVALQPEAQPVSLPPTQERDLSNASYVEQVIAATTTTSTTTTTTIKKSPQIAAGTTIPGTTTTTTTVRPPSIVGTPSTTSSTTSTSSTTTSSTTTTIPINCTGLQLESSDWGGNPPYSFMYLTKNGVYAQDECYPAQVTVRYYSDGARTQEYPNSSQIFTLNGSVRFDHVCPASAAPYVYWRATATRTAPFNYGTWSASPYGANSINC